MERKVSNNLKIKNNFYLVLEYLSMLLCLFPQYSQDIQRKKLCSTQEPQIWFSSPSPLVGSLLWQNGILPPKFKKHQHVLNVWLGPYGSEDVRCKVSASQFQGAGSESWTILFSLQWWVGFPIIAPAYSVQEVLLLLNPTLLPHGLLISLAHQQVDWSAQHTKSPLPAGIQMQTEERHQTISWRRCLSGI